MFETFDFEFYNESILNLFDDEFTFHKLDKVRV